MIRFKQSLCSLFLLYMATKTIKGQAWIVGDRLVQDQILIADSGIVTQGNVDLVPNIWEDLKKKTGQKYKSNSKKTYFYWEYDTTDPENDDLTIKVLIECPKPKDGMYKAPYKDINTGSMGDWEKYWVEKFKAAEERAQKAYVIQESEVTLPGTSYIDQKGNKIDLPEKVIKRGPDSDITNLLGMF